MSNRTCFHPNRARASAGGRRTSKRRRQKADDKYESLPATQLHVHWSDGVNIFCNISALHSEKSKMNLGTGESYENILQIFRLCIISPVIVRGFRSIRSLFRWNRRVEKQTQDNRGFFIVEQMSSSSDTIPLVWILLSHSSISFILTNLLIIISWSFIVG